MCGGAGHRVGTPQGLRDSESARHSQDEFDGPFDVNQMTRGYVNRADAFTCSEDQPDQLGAADEFGAAPPATARVVGVADEPRFRATDGRSAEEDTEEGSDPEAPRVGDPLAVNKKEVRSLREAGERFEDRPPFPVREITGDVRKIQRSGRLRVFERNEVGEGIEAGGCGYVVSRKGSIDSSDGPRRPPKATEANPRCQTFLDQPRFYKIAGPCELIPHDFMFCSLGSNVKR